MSKINPADESAAGYLEEQRKHFGKAENILLAAGCAILFIGLTVLFFILPKKEYSKTENRTLAQYPEFTFEKLKEGSYTSGIVSYLKDHFPMRDSFMELDALGNLATGQMGSGGVNLGKDGYLIYDEHPVTEKERKALAKKKVIIDALSEKLPTVTAIAGKGSEVMVNKYPAVIDASVAADNRAVIKSALEEGRYDYLDLAALLTAYNEEEIYYRTDHHWTATGAYYAARAILTQFGKDPAALGELKKEVVTADFKGTLYNRSGMYFLSGEELFFLRYEGDDGYTVTKCRLKDGEDGRTVEEAIGVSDSLYDLSCLEEEYRGTAYDAFVAPVSVPVVRIEKKDGGERERLLVVKDSFAHSVLPYLANYYDIVSVDIRKNADYALQLIEEGAVDRVLILVNSETLFSEN